MERKNPLAELFQPFRDLWRAPRALWGLNVADFLEGLVYFGILGYLAMFFNEAVGLDDVWAGRMVGVLTYGITFAMFLLGGLADKYGVRRALLVALALAFVGRVLISAGPTLGWAPGGLGSPIFWLVVVGILFVVLGYGMFQPAAYAAVRQFTTPKTASMGYAMLYAVMNLGGWLPSFAFLLRDSRYAGLGIGGVYWVYAALTLVALIVTAFVLQPRVVAKAIAEARKESGAVDKQEMPTDLQRQPFSLWKWLKNHPLADLRFSFFVFSLIPVQTLFAHNWLTLPMYVERAHQGTWIGTNFELAVNFNPLLIFVLVPIVAALTQKRKVYNMMLIGTFVMAAPTFLLSLTPSFWTLLGYLVIMTIGEAMWQPRFLQYAAQIAPEGRTGAYMGVAQFPWFLTKVITSLYSGWFLATYCPANTPSSFLQSEKMWFIYGCIAMSSTVLLLIGRRWVTKGNQTEL